MESDQYDDYAVHLLASHRHGEPAGTARLVLPSDLGFPAAEHCEFWDEYTFVKDPSHPNTRGYGELSRLAVAKRFRRRASDGPYGGRSRPNSDPAASEHSLRSPAAHNAPEILIGLCRLLYQESKRRGLTHWLVAMERGLFMLLRRMGFGFFPVGPEVDYYGPVRPYVVSLDGLERGLQERAPETLRYLTQGLEPELVPDCINRAKAATQYGGKGEIATANQVSLRPSRRPG